MTVMVEWYTDFYDCYGWLW